MRSKRLIENTFEEITSVIRELEVELADDRTNLSHEAKVL
jgi:hypothetical protein